MTGGETEGRRRRGGARGAVRLRWDAAPSGAATALALGLALAAAPGALRGQEGVDTAAADPRAIVLGQVTGETPDEPLAGAMVYVQGEDFTAITDSLGLYAMAMPPGVWVLSVFHPRAAELGLEQPPRSFVTLDAGTQLRVDFSLGEDVLGSQASPYVLEALEVMVAASRTVPYREVGANIQVLRPEVLEARVASARNVADLFRGQFTGVRVTREIGNDVCVESSRGAMRRTLGPPPYCSARMALVVDDILVDDPGGYLASLSPEAVQRVEYMPAYQASTRYGKRGANGVLFIWTR